MCFLPVDYKFILCHNFVSFSSKVAGQSATKESGRVNYMAENSAAVSRVTKVGCRMYSRR